MTQKLKNGEIIERWRMLEQPLNLRGIKLLYARKRNLDRLGKIVKAMEPDVVIPMSEDYRVYDQAVKDLFKKYADNGDGTFKTKMVPGPKNEPVSVYDTDTKDPQYQAEAKALNKKNKKLIEERNDQIKDYEAYLEKDFTEDLELFYVKLDDLPEDISEGAFGAISWMIREEPEDSNN